MKINENASIRLLVPLAMVLAGGCAGAYHSYSDCCVPCKYCPPPPLPYMHYKGCACHSCAAEKFLSRQPSPLEHETTDAEHDGAAN